MEDLTFGEQVKIILSRKGMTIKQLAEIIEERTGKPMSRQNLTQRLGRDNFQEQDMRMIASILGCPFHLSIFAAEVGENSQVNEDAISKYTTSKTQQKNIEDISLREQMDLTVGEIYDMHRAQAEEAIEEIPDEVITEREALRRGETLPMPGVKEVEAQAMRGDTIDMSAAAKVAQQLMAEEEQQRNQAEAPIEEVQEQKLSTRLEKFRTGAIFLRKKGVDTDTGEINAKKRRTPIMGDPDFQPVYQHKDIEEDRELGEINPYTGREYQTNSVRMHPKKIGFVQVYDRAKHGWTDMTEWAFLGFQEKKKVELGKNYEPPIYLD